MNKNAVKTLIIIDEDLETLEGHPYEYNKSVQEFFQHKGFNVRIYGHANMFRSFCDELGAKPWFTFNRKAPVRKIPVLGHILYRRNFWKLFRKELRLLLEDVEKDTKDYILLFSNVYWYNISPIAEVLKDTNKQTAIVFHTSIFKPLRLPQFVEPITLGIIKRSVNLLRNNSNIHYFSDSSVVADEWKTHLQAHMDVLPIPHLTYYDNVKQYRPGDKMRMYLPGGMRLEKGAALLAEAFELLAKQNRAILEKITLVTQFRDRDTELQPFKARLAALPVENEFLQRLSTEEYNRQISIADVILLPYKASEGYRARTSGILGEAIAARKPFIASSNTWMSLQAEKYDTGIVVKDGDAQALADAIYRITGDYETYLKKAETASREWEKTQSKEIYYQVLLKHMKL